MVLLRVAWKERVQHIFGNELVFVFLLIGVLGIKLNDFQYFLHGLFKVVHQVLELVVFVGDRVREKLLVHNIFAFDGAAYLLLLEHILVDFTGRVVWVLVQLVRLLDHALIVVGWLVIFVGYNRQLAGYGHLFLFKRMIYRNVES